MLKIKGSKSKGKRQFRNKLNINESKKNKGWHSRTPWDQVPSGRVSKLDKSFFCSISKEMSTVGVQNRCYRSI